MRRLREIERLTDAAQPSLARAAAGAGASTATATRTPSHGAGSAVAERCDFDEVNTLIATHNRWYPTEARLPMDVRRRDYVLVGGRPYTRRPLDAVGCSSASRPSSPPPSRVAAASVAAAHARVRLMPRIRPPFVTPAFRFVGAGPPGSDPGPAKSVDSAHPARRSARPVRISWTTRLAARAARSAQPRGDGDDLHDVGADEL